MKKLHVGVHGRKRSGKDTVGSWFVERGWTRVAFADPLKEMALAVDPLVEIPMLQGTAHLRLSLVVAEMGWETAKEYPDVRRFLQRLGAEGVRDHIGPDTWIDLAFREVRGPSVFTDVRMANEAEAIRARGGVVIHVVRDHTEPAGGPLDGHSSEAGIPGFEFDALIDNTGPLEDLWPQLADLNVRA